MAVKDFMTRKVVYISPDTTVAHAADLMREQGLHRLPVIENDQLVGLVTEGTIAEASPSKATSLSIYEMNYLLNKTKVKDVMIRDVVTVSGYASLEDGSDPKPREGTETTTTGSPPRLLTGIQDEHDGGVDGEDVWS